MWPWFSSASVSRRGVNRKYTRYTATIDTRLLTLSLYLYLYIYFSLSLSLSSSRGFYGASTSRNNRLAGGCVSNRIPGQLLRPRSGFCGNVVIDSVLQRCRWEREGNKRPRPIFKCGGANMLARLKGGLNPWVAVCLRNRTEEVGMTGKIEEISETRYYSCRILITRFGRFSYFLVFCCFFFFVV